jgi:hypothetical protein
MKLALQCARAKKRMLRRGVDAGDDDLVVLGEDVLDDAVLALVLAGDHAHRVALAELHVRPLR